MELSGKVAIVTGGGTGIGKAIAFTFSSQGAAAVVAARTLSRLEKVAEDIKSKGGRARAIQTDVTDEKHVQNMVAQTLNEYGQIDILVNNAGIAFYASVLETPLKRWELVLRVNLIGAFLCSKAVLPIMIKQGSGSIINISSLAANERDRGIVPTGVAYGVSKAGLDRFTWGLAAEVGEYNIAVNAIKPKKVVNTEGMRFWLPDADKSQWQSPEKMVKCAIFLASQDAKGITGVVATDEELCTWHGL